MVQLLHYILYLDQSLLHFRRVVLEDELYSVGDTTLVHSNHGRLEHDLGDSEWEGKTENLAIIL